MISEFTTEIMNPMQRQAASIDGGSGDDFITVEVGLLENVIDAGDGNDVVSITNYGLPDATVTVDLGAGDDKLSVNPHFGSMTITTGDGQDVINIETGTLLDDSQIVITDFTTGAAGDTLIVEQILTYGFNWSGLNPFGSGEFALEQRGTDVVLVVTDLESETSFNVVVFNGTAVADFVDTNFAPALAVDGTPFAEETIIGTPDDDYLNGDIGDDFIYGLEGNDYIEGKFGQDSIYGGLGNDWLNASRNGGLLDGGDGDDSLRIYGGKGDFQMYGGAGSDSISANSEGNITIDGGDGDDWIGAYNTADYYYYDRASTDDVSISEIHSGAGNDFINFDLSGASVDITTGDGDDEVKGGLLFVDETSIDLGAGDDVLEVWTTGENLTITTGDGQDTISVRGPGPNQRSGYTITDFSAGIEGDKLDLTDLLNNLSDWDGGNPFGSGHLVLEQRGADTILTVLNEDGETYFDAVIMLDTSVGDLTSSTFEPVIALDGTLIAEETIVGTSGNDALSGNMGMDHIYGNNGNDFIEGNFGPDDLYGGAGNDTLISGNGGNLYGGDGDDFLAGYDSWQSVNMYGGAGHDVFQLEASNTANISTGADSDVVVIEFYGYPLAGGITVTDFTAGENGDLLFIEGGYEFERYGSWSESSELFELHQNGANTELVFTGPDGDLILAVLNNVDATTLTTENIGGIGLPPIVNQGPVVVSALPDITILEDAGALALQINAGAFSDPDGDTLAYSASLANGGPLPSWLAFDTNTLQLTGTPPANFNGLLSIRVEAFDGEYSVSQAFDLIIGAVNDAPAGAVTVSGDLVDGETLTATSDVTDADGIASSGFVWRRDGVVISGATGAIFGNKGSDIISGGGKSDRIYGGAGGDEITGDNGRDRIFGGNGADKLYGGGKADQLYGGAKADKLYGGTGGDKLYCGNGTDKIDGGAGRDVMTGGAGADKFIFDDKDSSTANRKRDVITDFSTGADNIDLRLMDANTDSNSDDAFAFSGTRAAGNSVWYEVDGSNVVVFGDQNGDRIADFEIKLLDVSGLSAGDFLL